MLCVVDMPTMLAEVLDVAARVPEQLLAGTSEATRVHEIVQQEVEHISLKHHEIDEALVGGRQVPDRELIGRERAAGPQVVHRLQDAL